MLIPSIFVIACTCYFAVDFTSSVIHSSASFSPLGGWLTKWKASLCGHYEVTELLLENGALCERDTFAGERCLYNALNDRIRNLLLSYDYAKSTNPLQPFAAHISSLLARRHPATWDISLICGTDVLRLHKFILAARSPYFARKLASSPEITSWRLPNSVPIEAITATIRFAYLSELPSNLGDNDNEDDVLRSMDKFSRLLEIDRVFEFALNRENRRFARQRMSDEITRGRDEIYSWFINNILRHKIVVDSSKVNKVKWTKNNAIFADVLVRADETAYYEDDINQPASGGSSPKLIPIGPLERESHPSGNPLRPKSVLFPVHKAMLIRSDYFLKMFSSGFLEAQESEHLPIVSVGDCAPDVLEVILAFLYSEKADFPLEIALEVLFAADLLLLEKLKVKASTIISSLGSSVAAAGPGNSRRDVENEDEDVVDIYEVVRAGWAVRVRRLEEFGARQLAQRLEKYIVDEEFAVLVQESADRVKNRQETDTIELIDDIRYYLSERYRLRFEDAGLEEMMEDDADIAHADAVGSDGQDLGVDQQNISSLGTVVRTLDGDEVGDEFDEDARMYESLMAKLDSLLEKLNLDA
jgi:ankyrin repeat and BTB/POZ domain-containing protein 1